MSSPKITSAPAPVEPKIGTLKTLNEKLARGAGYLGAQVKGDPTNKLSVQVTALSAAHQEVTAKLVTKNKLQLDVNANNLDILTAVRHLDNATIDYARAAARFADTDTVLLAALGVEAAKKGGNKAGTKVPEAPVLLAIAAGANPGEALLRCRKVARAGSYVFEYKAEQALPTDPWLPGGGIQTTFVSAMVSGLAPSQHIRARVRAIGATSGPWSEEVVGRAR
jgi:hypothetical protein